MNGNLYILYKYKNALFLISVKTKNDSQQTQSIAIFITDGGYSSSLSLPISSQNPKPLINPEPIFQTPHFAPQTLQESLQAPLPLPLSQSCPLSKPR